MCQRLITYRLEERHVLLIRAGVAPLDVVDAERIQATDKLQLATGRKGHTFCLRAIAQRCVIDCYSLFHRVDPHLSDHRIYEPSPKNT